MTTGAEPALGAYRVTGGGLQDSESRARGLWDGSQVFTLIPIDDLPAVPLRWDLAVFAGAVTPATPLLRGDSLRSNTAQPLGLFDPGAKVLITDDR